MVSKATGTSMGGRRRKTMKKGGKPRKTASKKKTMKRTTRRVRRVRRARRGGMDDEGNLTPEELAMYKKFAKLMAAADPRVTGVSDEEVAKAAAELAEFEKTIPAELKDIFEEMVAEAGEAAAAGDD